MVMKRRRRNNKQVPTNIQIPQKENPLILERKPVNRKDYGSILQASKKVSPNRRRTSNKERK
jgi:hypothetical protein